MREKSHSVLLLSQAKEKPYKGGLGEPVIKYFSNESFPFLSIIIPVGFGFNAVYRLLDTISNCSG